MWSVAKFGEPKLANGLNRALWVLGIAAFVVHAWILSSHLVDLPYADEWTDFADARSFSPRLNLTWLLSTQQNHPRVLQTFFKWIDYHLTSGNYVAFAIFNFLCFALGSALLVRMLEKRLNLRLGLAFLLLSVDRVYENHAWANQGLFFHYVFFTYLGFFACFLPGRKSWWSFPAILLAAFSTIGGSTSALIYCLVNVSFAVGHFLRAPWARKADGDGPFQGWHRLVQAVLLMLVLAAWRTWGLFDNPMPELTPPWTLRFWHWFLNAFSSGFGHEKFHDGQGLVIGGLFLLAIAVVWNRLKKGASAETWSSWLSALSIALSLTGACAMLAIGRGTGEMWATKISRYASFGLFVMPIWWAFVLHAIGEVRTLPRLALAAIAFVLLVYPYGNNFRWNAYYAGVEAARRHDLQVLKGHFAGTGVWEEIPGLPLRKLESRFENMRKLGLSFLKQLPTPSVPPSEKKIGR